MMKKLFNKKAMIAYIIVLAITFIAGCSMIGVTVHYSNEIETLEKGDGSLESAASSAEGYLRILALTTSVFVL